jgi:hypothetical protein
LAAKLGELGQIVEPALNDATRERLHAAMAGLRHAAPRSSRPTGSP